MLNLGKTHIRCEGPTEPLDLAAVHEGPVLNPGKYLTQSMHLVRFWRRWRGLRGLMPVMPAERSGACGPAAPPPRRPSSRASSNR